MAKPRALAQELRRHAPFTALGTVSGGMVYLLLRLLDDARPLSETLFWIAHPLHVLVSAHVTTAVYRRHSRPRLWPTVVIGYLGSVGIATLSDSLIPFVAEGLLDMPHRGAHLGFIEKWWLVNPLAFAGILTGALWPKSLFPHAGHVLLSTWASLFHMTMAAGALSLGDAAAALVFLFLAVWIPCCTSDIVFPMLFATSSEAMEHSALTR